MNAVKIMTGMLPFALFSILAPPLGVGWAATAGLFSAILVVAATARDGVKELPAAQGVLLLGMAVIGFISDRRTDTVLIHYGPAIVALVLGAFMVATAHTTPFTAQFARRTVPPEIWHSRPFLEVNRRISIAWGLAVLFQGVCHVVGAQIGVEGLQLALRISLNQVVPLLALLVAAAYTKRLAAAGQRRAQEHMAQEHIAPGSIAADPEARERAAHGAHEAGRTRS